MNNQRPRPDEYADWHKGYVSHTSGERIDEALADALARTESVVSGLSESQAEIGYAPGKWSIKDLLQHMIDSEWIFAYRALRFARQDSTDLPGFDHDGYVVPARANNRSLQDLLTDMRLLRTATRALFASFDDDALMSRGVANGQTVSVRALGWIIAGHQLHHLSIITERYLPVI